MADENEEQVRYWNEEAGPKWVKLQALLDRQLEYFKELLITTAAIAPGDRVLDIGCGCGASTVAAGECVGIDGSVTGVDISRPMLERARSRAAAAGHFTTDFLEADATDCSWPDSDYDIVISRFGCMFFADPEAAFTNIRSALRPGGRITFMAWQAASENPWMLMPLMAVAHLLELPEPPDPYEPGPFALADEERTKRLLEAAGFSEVKVEPMRATLPVGEGPDIDDAINFVMQGVGPLSRLLKEQPPEKHEEVRVALHEALAPLHTPQGVMMEFAPLLITGINP